MRSLSLKLTKKILLSVTLILSTFLFSQIMHRNCVIAELAVIPADIPWKMTDIILKENSFLTWNVSKDKLWSFNKEVFPDGHDADGIKGVPALYGHVYPGENLGKLIGRIGDSGRMFPMGNSGQILIHPNEGGNYLYLTINDEIGQSYGKGFKDNLGEILVSITQKPRESLNIQFLFYKECPSYKLAYINLEEALKEEEIEEWIQIIKVENEQEAKNLQLSGSPTIRINGIDIDPASINTKNYGIHCRNYSINGKSTGWPDKVLIKQAIQKAKGD